MVNGNTPIGEDSGRPAVLQALSGRHIALLGEPSLTESHHGPIRAAYLSWAPSPLNQLGLSHSTRNSPYPSDIRTPTLRHPEPPPCLSRDRQLMLGGTSSCGHRQPRFTPLLVDPLASATLLSGLDLHSERGAHPPTANGPVRNTL